MKRFWKYVGLVVIVAVVAVWPPRQNARADEQVDSFMAGMADGLENIGAQIGPLDAAQKPKVAGMLKSIAAKLNADPSLMKASPHKLQGDAIAGFREILTAPQQKKLDVLLAENLQRANNIKSAASLRMIREVAEFHAVSNDIMPKDIGSLITDATPAEYFISPFSDVKLPEELKSDPKGQTAWVNKNTDYVFLGAGKTAQATSGDFIIAHEKPGINPMGVNFLKGDGSVYFEKTERANKILAELKAGVNPPKTVLGAEK